VLKFIKIPHKLKGRDCTTKHKKYNSNK